MKTNISKYYCKTTDPAFDEYVELAREQYGDECANNLTKFKRKCIDVYVNAGRFSDTGGYATSDNFYPNLGLQPFTTQQHIEEPIMNDAIMKAVVALKGDLSNVVNRYMDSNEAISLFLDDAGFWLTTSTFNKLCNGDRCKKGELIPICTVAEFEEAAAQWKAAQPKPQEASPDVIPFELESGKHAVKMADGKFGIVLGEYIAYECGFDVIATVKSKIVGVRKLNSLKEGGMPLLGFGVKNLLSMEEQLHLLWEKPVKVIKTPQQLEVERLQKLLADTQAELNKLTGSDTGGLNV